MKVHPDDVKANVERIIKKHGPGRLTALRRALVATADFLSQNPIHYQFYGPYWWVLKALVKEHVGDAKVVWWAGDEMDDMVRERYATGNDLNDLAACLLYQADRSGDFVNAPERHDIVGESDDDTDSYTVSDPDMRRG